jgi:hypothetical protein
MVVVKVEMLGIEQALLGLNEADFGHPEPAMGTDP